MTLFTLIFVFGLVFSQPVQVARADTLPAIDNTTTGTIYDNTCGTYFVERYFLVTSHFTVSDVSLGLEIDHDNRGDLVAKLTSPKGTVVDLFANSSDTNNDYDIMLVSSGGTTNLNDNNADTVPDTAYERSVTLATLGTAFDNEDAFGGWQVFVCDNVASNTGTFNRAQLNLTGTPIPAFVPQHKQGVAISETYFTPWPEDDLWTAMGSIFSNGHAQYPGDDEACPSGTNYDAQPMQPMINYSSITVTESNTVITYDQWEDGYEAAADFPTQNTTEVWGDGDLANGAAPGDADDVLTSGQVLILKAVLNTTNLQTVVDYDASDMISSTQPIAVSRSLWANGSSTLFAHADEVYPTNMWGTDYLLPVGENLTDALNEMFQYTGVSVMAELDGTTVYIDKNNDGSPDVTTSLNQGQAYLWDDSPATNVIGAGLNRGSHIYSNAGHPIQVNLLTGDVCAFFETRSFPLLPTNLWSNSYYNPVGTLTTAGGTMSDYAPTYVHLFNPNNRSITVNYAMGGGTYSNTTLTSRSGTYVTMTDLMGGHFYSSNSTAGSFTAIDNFGTQAFSNNDGTMTWATNWDETGDDDSATAGSILINTNLRFSTASSANVGDTIEREVNLSGATAVTLSFSQTNSSTEAGDTVVVELSNNGGSSWTQVGPTLVGNTNPAYSQNILSYASANTRVRFRIAARSGDTNAEYIAVDGVTITATLPSSAMPFYAVATVDSENSEQTAGPPSRRNDTYDWGFTLVPEKTMSQWLIVGWAPGDDPTYRGTAPENTSPIWLTGGHPGSTSNTTFDVCIDDGGNGGSNTDPVTSRPYDRKITGVAPRTQQKIYYGGSAVAGQDQTATQIWVCGPTTEVPANSIGTDGVNAPDATVLNTDAVITAAWGSDPLTAAGGKPSMDMGDTVRNLRTWLASKGAALQVDVNGNGLFDEGDTIRYTIQVRNSGASAINANTLDVTDVLDTNTTYVAGSTRLTDHTGAVTTIADDAPTAFPLDAGGFTYASALPAGLSFYIRFDVTINTTEPLVNTRVNTATVTDGITTLRPQASVPIQARRLGAIGNYVWLDEDGDGDQDAGEAGIPNVKVELLAADGTTVLATTYTDANGGYLFPDLAVGSYSVRTTPPANLNPTYDENGVGTPNITSFSLSSGEEHLTADFGYNWSTTSETNTPVAGSQGAIGDRIWVDSDSDGKQDPAEIGIQNVSVQLTAPGADGIFGTADDTTSTTTTDVNGNYIFDGLSAGSYVVTVLTPPVGYTQTGDPDHFGTTGTNDNTTTAPIVLGPGDVFVNADFGYNPPADALVADVGDTIWFDADGDSIYEPNGSDGNVNTTADNEYGIPGVTVSLILDLNGDHAYQPGSDPIIAATVTDANGMYLFPDVPANSALDYLVWVDDTVNVLGDLVPTYDNDGHVATPNVSAVIDLNTSGNLFQDFGYAPADHTTGDGLIGDFVWLDKDGDGVQDAGEPGLEGVVVRLYDGSGALQAVTVTDENGHYSFGNLAVSAGGTSYQVQVVSASLPGGLTQTGDPDAVKDNTSTVSLTTAAPVNLNQDFGYQGTNTISGTIWTDTNADGTLSGEAGRFQGVTVVLRDASGDVVATTTTDASGNYSFTNLPNGTYTVDVTDDANVLNGYWKSNGPTPGADNNSQVDPYSVTVTGGQTNTTADFGYYLQPAALGNFVWEDLDGDGVQDAGEPGIPNVPVTLTIAYPGAGSTTVVALTDASGFYSFANLLLDEDYALADVNSGTVTLTVSASVPGYLPTVENLVGNNDQTDGDSDGASEIATVLKGETDNAYDFGFVRPGSIGNYVWLDEDGDADQDAGEAGIPNLKVELCTDASCATVLQTTYTDANGGYLFSDLPRGTYYVKVTPPANLNPTYDENGIGTPNITSVTLGIGEEHLTADFGYNWSTTTETNNPGPTSDNTGAIGDRVWIDADGDGVQDSEEVGLAGISVSLYCDLNSNGVIDSSDLPACATTTTDANGNYVFDNLPAGIYQVLVNGGVEPLGYDQTGDPDNFGALCLTCDNRSSVDLVLGPGDVFVNVDFGYKPETSLGFIGDTVWLDANVNGVRDIGTEWGIPGVTVALIKDVGTIGVYEPGIDLIIATDITDSGGQYLFSGLPAGGGQDYLVWVNDTDNVLGDLVPTYDSNGIGTPNVSPATNLPLSGDLNQDFGYAPAGHDAGEGIIGDQIFLDRNNNGVPDWEGLEGVRVGLYDSTGTNLLAMTVTDENGVYLFGGLNPTGTYVVKVVTSTLPAGVTNTVDPDGGTANQSTVNLALSGGINLAQDFGYQGTNTISGTIWTDANADGTLSGESGWFQGVTVVLRDASGDVVATTTTDASGNFSFTNLPNGTYTVDVTDDANVLNGYWKSNGPNAGSDNNSQVDPYTVTVTGGQTNTTADFGYFQQPAGLGNLVWNDADNDGIQDAGEAPMAGITVTLTITYPNGQATTLTTTTDANGLYFFGNLLQDEDFDGVGTSGVGGSEPQFKLTVAIPSGMIESLSNQGSNNAIDSDGVVNGTNVEVVVGDVNNAASLLVKGATNPDYDFGFLTTPTVSFISELPQAVGQDHAILVTWATSDETEVISFDLYRTTSTIETRILVYHVQGQNQEGYAYSFLDEDVVLGMTYSYWLEVRLDDGTIARMSPAMANPKTFIYLPVTSR